MSATGGNVRPVSRTWRNWKRQSKSEMKMPERVSVEEAITRVSREVQPPFDSDRWPALFRQGYFGNEIEGAGGPRLH